MKNKKYLYFLLALFIICFFLFHIKRKPISFEEAAPEHYYIINDTTSFYKSVISDSFKQSLVLDYTTGNYRDTISLMFNDELRFIVIQFSSLSTENLSNFQIKVCNILNDELKSYIEVKCGNPYLTLQRTQIPKTDTIYFIIPNDNIIKSEILSDNYIEIKANTNQFNFQNKSLQTLSRGLFQDGKQETKFYIIQLENQTYFLIVNNLKDKNGLLKFNIDNVLKNKHCPQHAV